jgi:REP element-mobilizing transposase RayT
MIESGLGIKGVDEYLMIKMDEIRKRYPEIEYVQRNIQPDHIYMAVCFPPKYSISKVVQIIEHGGSVVDEV